VKLHITETALANLNVPAGKKWLAAYDTELSGFVAIKTESGAMSYVVMYRNQDGQKRQEKLAAVGSVSAQAARGMARSRLADLAQTPQTRHQATCPTMSDYFYGTYLPVVRANSRSHETHASVFRNHVNDRLGHLRLDEVSDDDILALKRHLEQKPLLVSSNPTKTLSPATVTRILILVRHLFNTALKDKTIPVTHNPTYVVQLKSSRTMKGTFLTPVQLRRLLAAAQQSQNPDLADIIPVMGGTGLRRANVLEMEWDWLDLAAGTLSVPQAEDKAKQGFTIHLSEGVLAVLKRRQDNGSRWVFPSPKTGLPFLACRQAWVTTCERAGLSGLRMHDLRHTYASLMLDSGANVVDVKHALGHTQLSTTEVYLHLRDARKRETANAAAMASGLFA